MTEEADILEIQERARIRSVRVPQAEIGHGMKPAWLSLLERLKNNVGPFAGQTETEADRRRRETKKREQDEEYLIKICGISSGFLNFDISRIPSDMPAGFRRMAARLLELTDRSGDVDRRTIAICGEVGRGKTLLAAGLCRHFVQERPRRSCRYITAQRLDSLIAEADFGKKEAARTQFERAELLVIDEVADERFSYPRGNPDLVRLLDARWSSKRATLLLTNQTPAGLWEAIGQPGTRRVQKSGGLYIAAWPEIDSIYEARKTAAK